MHHYASYVDYSNLAGTIPTWNQDTTGTAATAFGTLYRSDSRSPKAEREGADYAGL